MEKSNKKEKDNIITWKNKDGSVTIISKDDQGSLHIFQVFANKTNDFKQKYRSVRSGLIGKVGIPALLAAIVISVGIYGVNTIKDNKEKKALEELEEERIKNNLNYNINNADLTVVRSFLDEVLCDLNDVRNSNLMAENAYKAMYSELSLAETTNDYALHIKEGAKNASIANIYFGVGKYAKYLIAKNCNGQIYFPFYDVLPAYSLEDIAGDIVITYLPGDETPYVTATELEKFTKSQEIKAYIKSL